MDKEKRQYGEGCYIFLKSKGKYRVKKSFSWSDENGKHVKTIEAQGATRYEAKKRWNEKVTKLKKGIKENENILFHDALMLWLDYKKLEMKKSSYEKLEQNVRCRVFVSKLNNIPVKQITYNDIDDFLNNYAKTGPSFSSYKKAYEIFTGFYRWAVRKKIVEINPTENMVFLKAKSEIFKKRKEVEWLDNDDIKKIISEATKLTKYDNYKGCKGPFYPQGFAIAANIFLGMRVSEFIALKWKDVDFSNEIINVDKQLKSMDNPEYDSKRKDEMKLKGIPQKILVEQEGLKYGAKRDVALNQKAKELLTKAKEYAIKCGLEDYVCQTREGKNCCPESLRGAMKTIEKYAGTKCQSAGFHVLRHTCATMMYTVGISIEDIADTLGDDIKVVESTYIHSEKKRGVLARNNRINEKLNDLF